eukprot:NODE_12388_length_1227_cov_11.265455.p1 GENE.NODE_12388_length_1227_cov_11.265455~~NODE_12388_length_1227_cov_11.265455.p1  ORF type:complete len:257 (+),score=53.00 NODE_12388_length_1227_cov_11.265455:2-772(+)
MYGGSSPAVGSAAYPVTQAAHTAYAAVGSATHPNPNPNPGRYESVLDSLPNLAVSVSTDLPPQIPNLCAGAEAGWCCCPPRDMNSEMVLAVAPEPLIYAPVVDEGQLSGLRTPRARRKDLTIWEDWMRELGDGRAVTIITHATSLTGENTGSCYKLSAVVYLNLALTKLTFYPDMESDFFVISVLVDHVQVVCAALAFKQFHDRFGCVLSEKDMGRAVLLQYTTEDFERKVICFLEVTGRARDTFVDALTAIRVNR